MCPILTVNAIFFSIFDWCLKIFKYSSFTPYNHGSPAWIQLETLDDKKYNVSIAREFLWLLKREQNVIKDRLVCFLKFTIETVICAQVVLPQFHERISVFKLLALLLIHLANLSMMSNEVLHKQNLKRKRQSSSKTERKRPRLAEEKTSSSKTHNCEDTPCLDVKTPKTTKRVSLYINELKSRQGITIGKLQQTLLKHSLF